MYVYTHIVAKLTSSSIHELDIVSYPSVVKEVFNNSRIRTEDGAQ
jgi:hypothetical protein